MTDLAAVRYRFDQLGAQRIIYVVGSPQANYLPQVFAVSAMAGSVPWCHPGTRRLRLLLGSMQMFKTREGKAVTLDTLLDLAEDVAAPEIAMAAVKYADLSTSLHTKGNHVFDADRMVRDHTGTPARTCSTRTPGSAAFCARPRPKAGQPMA